MRFIPSANGSSPSRTRALFTHGIRAALRGALSELQEFKCRIYQLHLAEVQTRFRFLKGSEHREDERLDESPAGVVDDPDPVLVL